MRQTGLFALALALCSAPVADACFLKCFCRSDRTSRSVEVNTVTILSIDGQAPQYDSINHRWYIKYPVRTGVPIQVYVRTNFTPNNPAPMYSLACACPSAPAPATVAVKDGRWTTHVGPGGETYTDLSPFSIGSLQPLCSCTLRVTVDMTSSETVYFTTAAQ
jgi:hypothetical protein